MGDTPNSATQYSAPLPVNVAGPAIYTDVVSAVTDVAEGVTPAAVIAGYLSSTATAGLQEAILGCPELTAYTHVEEPADVTGPLKIGHPYYDAHADPVAERAYWRTSRAASGHLRALLDPYLPPMDRVQVDLEEGRAGGRRLRNVEGEAAFAGLVRVFREGAEALPHTDNLAEYAPPGRLPGQPICQLAVNAFVAGGEGGAVELWNTRPSGAAYDALLEPGSYGISRARLGAPMRRIEPRTGDLVIFDARYVHAVRRVDRGPRITVSAFIVRFEPSGPFFIYS